MTHPNARVMLRLMPYFWGGAAVLLAVWLVVCAIAWLCGYDASEWLRPADWQG